MDNVQRALDFIKKKYFAGLYAFDELSQGVANKELLLGFETLPCTFSPTFKVQREPGFVYKEQRTPSFTDRILYKSAPGLQGRLQQVSYEACPDCISSDHKPIRGAFSIVPNASKPKPRRNPVSKSIVGLNRNKKVFRVTISELKYLTRFKLVLLPTLGLGLSARFSRPAQEKRPAEVIYIRVLRPAGRTHPALGALPRISASDM